MLFRSDEPYLGYWEKLGWSDAAPYKPNALIFQPDDDAKLSVGKPVVLAGPAFAGSDPVVKVEWRLNEGPWQPCTLDYAPGPDVWTLWRATWTPTVAGSVSGTGTRFTFDYKGADTALAIWGYAEVGYQERQSSALLQQVLTDAGFQVTAGVADIPTAFVAEYRQGEGGPVLGVLGEFDALPGVSQAASPVQIGRAHV